MFHSSTTFGPLILALNIVEFVEDLEYSNFENFDAAGYKQSISEANFFSSFSLFTRTLFPN